MATDVFSAAADRLLAPRPRMAALENLQTLLQSAVHGEENADYRSYYLLWLNEHAMNKVANGAMLLAQRANELDVTHDTATSTDPLALRLPIVGHDRVTGSGLASWQLFMMELLHTLRSGKQKCRPLLRRGNHLLAWLTNRLWNTTETVEYLPFCIEGPTAAQRHHSPPVNRTQWNAGAARRIDLVPV
jgi:hypothetical protein